MSTHAADGKDREYRLTEAGAEFKSVVESLGDWGQRWTVRVAPAHLDAGFLMWNLHRRIGFASAVANICGA